MSRVRKFTLASVALAVAACAGAASAGLPWKGYLGAAGPDTLAMLAPPPAPGSAEAETDRSIFRATRTLEGTPRWDLAINDLSQSHIVADLSCAVGVELRARDLPALRHLLLTMAPDVSRAVSRPKATYRRPRPYLIDPGPICTDRTAALARSPDYPSGHATWGWSVGLVMAELVPDRSSAILARGRVFGESRMVCGVHNASAVAAGRTNAETLVAMLHASPAFRADLETARAELARVIRTGRPATGCAAEAAAIATPLP